MDYKQLYRLEQKCILGLDNKDTYKTIIHDIEAKIIKMYDKIHILRALCIFSIINGGLDQEDFDYLRKAFIMHYGHHHIVTLMNLEDAGILKAKNPNKDIQSFSRIDDTFNLFNEK